MTPAANHAVRALRELLEELTALHEELAVVLRAKLDAMRHARTADMQSATAREGLLVERISRLDFERHAVVGRVFEALGLPRSKDTTITQLASAVGEPDRDRLIGQMQALRERMLKVAEANRVVALVSGEMLAHYRNVFAVMTQTTDEPTGYTRGGRPAAESIRVLDAVG